MARKPFSFRRMTGAELADALRRVQLTPSRFSRLTGADDGVVLHWLSGKEEIPPWVPTFLAVLTLPSAVATAKWAAAQYLIEEDDDGQN